MPLERPFAAPAAASGAAFRLRVTDPRLRLGARPWLLAGDRDWQALWILPGWEGARLLWSRGKVPGARGRAELSLPAGDAAFAGSLQAVLEALHPEVLPWLRALPGQAMLLEGSLAPPEEPDQGMALAGALALLEAAAALPSRLLGEARVALGRDRLRRVTLDARLVSSPPLQAAAWGRPWTLRGLPEGVLFLRLEVASAALWPRARARLERWGLPVPAPPAVDPALELHVLLLDGEPCAVLAAPAVWLPPGALDSAEELAAARALPDRVLGVPVHPESLAAGDATVLVLGSSKAVAAVRRELAEDRPLPFAELRWRWPRGGLGLILDLDGLQTLARAASPLPLPALAPSAGGRLVECLAAPEGGGVGIHAAWPWDTAAGARGLLGGPGGAASGHRLGTELVALLLPEEARAALLGEEPGD